MTGRRMLRYEIPIDDQPHTIPLSRDPVAVAAVKTRFAVEFWAEDTPGARRAERTFQVFGTGHPLPGDAQWIGTCARSDEGFAWHLYEVTS
jgi:hypothetical protein